MPLLLIPLAFLVLLALWVLLLPLSLWQRFRMGRAQRRALPWLVSFNAWLLLASVLVFLAVSALAQFWFPHNLAQAGAGLLAGALLGSIALRCSRFEWRPQGLFYTPNLWITLGLTLLVAGRVLISIVQLARQGMAWWHDAPMDLDWHDGLVALAGVLLGHALVYAWGLRRRLRRGGRTG